MGYSEYDAELTTSKSAVADLQDQELLANIGYKQELKRSFSLLSMIGFCFSILTCWGALAGSLAEIFANGGPAVLIFGWIGCCFFTLFVVAILAELCSAYPVAGGQYSWILLLSKDTKWGRSISYICGWVQTTGILGMVAVGWYQFGLYLNAMISLTHPNYVASNWKTALFAYAAGSVALFIDVFGLKILHYLAACALWWQICGFIMCTVTILACAPKFQSADFVFTSSVEGGWTNLGMSVIVGLMQPAFGMCTYDSVAHLSEETNDAAKQCPRAMFLSIFIGFFTGLGFMLALLFCVQDLDAVIESPHGLPLLEIFYQATSNKAGAICLLMISFGCQVFTNISLLTEGSRAVYAFARDGAFPFKLNKYLQYVHPVLDVPIWALVFSFVVPAALVAMLFGSSVAFFTVLSIASTGLYASYLMLVVVYLFKSKNKAPGYYNLGKWGPWIAVPAVFYLLFCVIFFFFPTDVPSTGSTMNYCVVAFGIMAIFAIISWWGGARKTYIRSVSVLEGEEVIEELQQDKEIDEKKS